MDKIGVVGTGVMGAGIAQVVAEGGYSVLLFDAVPGAAEKAFGKLQKNWLKAVEKEKITQDEMKQRESLVKIVGSLAELKDCDLVIEAASENVEIKKSVFSQLDEICDAKTILVSNTSSLSITELGGFTKRPDRVAGMHFFNPVPVMKLTEIVRGLITSDETIVALQNVADKIKKVSVVVKDTPGFVVNRLLIPLCNEAIKMVEAGVASAKDIDTALKLAANWPMGPLEMLDMVGLDVHIETTAAFRRELNDNNYECARLAKQMVRANHLGVKTGKGFYEHNK